MKSGVLILIALFAVACGDDGGGTNSPPTAADLDLTTNEDSPITRGIEATDVDGDELTVTLSAPEHGTATVTGLEVTYTPATNYHGPDRITATVSDGTNTVDVTVNITVTSVNDAPAGVADAFACPEDTTLVISQASLVMNDTDLDSDPLSVTQVANVTNGVAMVNGLDVTFTPALNFSGTATFDYTVSDGTSTSTATVTITVGGANDAPNAVNDTATTPEDTAAVITNLLANDTDAEGQTLSITSVQDATNGTVALDGTTVTFTPTANFSGTATFKYTVTDGAASDTAVATVTVTAVNDAPLAVDDTASTAEDTAVNIATATVLANDSDVELEALAVTAVGNAVNGTVALVGTTITFTPNANFNGAGASFEYTVSDGAATDIGKVNLTVTAVNDPPVAVDDTKTTAEDTVLVFPATDLRANDTDVDNAVLTVTAVSNPANGTVTLSGGNITFTPAAGFSGPASFDYTISDGSLTDLGTVTVTVVAAIVCGDGAITAPETCDDGNAGGGDGCSATCQTETGFDCTGTPSTCSPICGDTIVIAGREACDDGNADNNDGCTTQCIVGAPCTVTQFPDGDRFAVDPSTGHCYVSFDDEQTTFAAAQTACAGEGGYLVTITSASENAIVLGALNAVQNPWIGATDDANDTDDVFDWVTDESFGFSNFAPGQPDDDVAFGGNGECLHITNGGGQWNDTNCNIDTFVVGRICEVEPVACGDSVLQTTEGEECDDSNAAPGDGCSATCQLEDGCGDGNLDAGEECDDDNPVAGDGCSATCQLEDGCGDGNLDAGEQCDDDNLAGGDGCSATCQFEIITTFTFTGAAGDEATLPADGGTPVGLSATPTMSRGSGVTPSAAGNTFSAANWATTATLDATDFFSFTISPDAGFKASMTKIELDERRSATGIRQWSVRSSVDGFATDLATFTVPDDTNTRTAQTITLPAASFTDVTTAVEFRIFGFQAEATTGTWRIDNVKVFGFTATQ